MLGPFGLYTHIAANRRRSWALLAGLALLVLVASFGIALVARGLSGSPAGSPGPADLRATLAGALRDALLLSPLSLAIAALWTYLGYRFHGALIDRLTGAAAGAPGETRVRRLLEPLCISRGLAVPRIAVSESPAPNAFATGMNPDQYAITVTRGLLDALDDAELEAVLAHELTHIRNDDVRVMVIAVVIAGGLSLVGELAWRWLSAGNANAGRRGGNPLAVVLGLALLAAAWGLSLAVRFALSRSREFLADAGAVELTKNPDAMIAALLKIEGRGEIEGAPSAVMELCLDNPRRGFSALFATHPPVAARIEALVAYAGGRLPAPAPIPFAPGPAHPWGRPPAGEPPPAG